MIFVRGGHPLTSLPFACADDATEIFRLAGDAAAGGPFRVDGTGKCSLGDVVSGPRKALAPVVSGTFARSRRLPEGAPGCAIPAGLQCPVGCALDTTFEDSTLSLPCRFTAASDGGLRCRPPPV